MAEQLDRLGLPYERYEAIRGDNLPEWLIPYFYNADRTLASLLSWGEIGCYASHLDLMRLVAENGGPALILEDDLRISGDFPETLRLMLDTELDWDILRISSRDKSQLIRVKKLNDDYSLVKYPRVPPNTGAYLIRPEGARKFLEWAKPRWRPVDQDLRRVWETHILTVGISPIPIIQNILPSSINVIEPRI